MSNPLKALIEFTSAYQQYATKDGQANPAATTHAQMQELFKNWSEILAALTNSIWQPSDCELAQHATQHVSRLCNRRH